MMDALSRAGDSRAGDLAVRLARGDHRGEGDAASVAAEIAANPGALPDLVACLFSRNATVRMRAADALERLSRGHGAWLDPYGERLLTEAAAIDQVELRWRLVQILPRLTLNDDQRRRALRLLSDWFETSPSRIVRSSALQAVVDLAERDADLRATAADMLGRAMRSGVPSLAARARRILNPFEVNEAILTAALVREPTGLSLTVLEDRLAVAQLPPGAGLPAWLDWSDPLVGATRTGEALSNSLPGSAGSGDGCGGSGMASLPGRGRERGRGGRFGPVWGAGGHRRALGRGADRHFCDINRHVALFFGARRGFGSGGGGSGDWLPGVLARATDG